MFENIFLFGFVRRLLTHILHIHPYLSSFCHVMLYVRSCRQADWPLYRANVSATDLHRAPPRLSFTPRKEGHRQARGLGTIRTLHQLQGVLQRIFRYACPFGTFICLFVCLFLHAHSMMLVCLRNCCILPALLCFPHFTTCTCSLPLRPSFFLSTPLPCRVEHAAGAVGASARPAA